MTKKQTAKPVPLESLSPELREYIRKSEEKEKRDAAKAHVVLAKARAKSRFVQAKAGRSGRPIRIALPPARADDPSDATDSAAKPGNR